MIAVLDPQGLVLGHAEDVEAGPHAVADAPSAPASSASPAPDGLSAMKCHRSSERGRVGGRGQPGSGTPRGQPWSPPPAAPDDSARAAGRVVFALAELQGLAAGDGPAHRAWPLQPERP